MSTRAAVCAAADIAAQPGTMHVRPAVQSRQAISSAAHNEIAVRANKAGAFTVGKNRNAPNDSQSVRATTSSTAPYSEPAAGAVRSPPRRETRELGGTYGQEQARRRGRDRGC